MASVIEAIFIGGPLALLYFIVLPEAAEGESKNTPAHLPPLARG